MLALVALGGLGARRPAALSGGQRQRVALARALINQPEVLLFDEPLGALDLKLRQQMQSELKALQRKVGITFVYVTHDQEEALGMSDRLAVFNLGRIEQIGTPEQIYERPATAFVAGFVGASNIVDAATAERLVGRRQAFSLRPERIRLGLDPRTGDGTADHGVDGTVISVQYHGASTRIEVALDGRHVLMVDRPNDLRSQARPEPGSGCGCPGRRPPCSRCDERRAMSVAATELPLRRRRPTVRPRPPPLHLPVSPRRSAHLAAAGAGARLARHRLSRLAVRAAGAELLRASTTSAARWSTSSRCARTPSC